MCSLPTAHFECKLIIKGSVISLGYFGTNCWNFVAFCMNCGLWLMVFLTTAETNMTYIVVVK